MSWLNLARRLPALWQNERTRAQLVGSASLLAGIGAGIASYAIWREPMQVRLDHLTIYLPDTSRNLPATGLRILHLSDTHFRGANGREQAKIASIRKACAGLEYDLLIHTGDFLHYDSGLPNVLTLLDALPTPRLGGYAVFGNHDYSVYSHNGMVSRAWANFQALRGVDETVTETVGDVPQAQGPTRKIRTNGNGDKLPSVRFQSAIANNGKNGHATPLTHARTLYQFGLYCANSPLDLKRIGRNDVNALEAALAARKIQTLHNRYVRLTHPEIGLDIYLAGIDDVVEGTPELQRALAEIPYDAPTILLSHNPDILGEPGYEQADLILSGHTHGGQIVLPVLGAAHTQTEYLRRHEVSGYLRRGKTQVYITRGVGEGIPLRFRASPQVTLITVMPA